MTTSKLHNTIGHIVMEDGTRYDIKVTYLNDRNEAMPCDLGSNIPLEMQTELQRLIKSMAAAHARTASKPCKDLRSIQLASSGVTFPDRSTHSHDITLETADKQGLSPQEQQTYSKVTQIWDKTAHLLVGSYQRSVEDFIEAPVSIAPSAGALRAPTTSIDLEVSPTDTRSSPPLPASASISTRSTPPPAYSTTPPSPTSLSGARPVSTRPLPAQPQRPLQSAASDLGRLPAQFNISALEALRQPVIRSHLTTPPTAAPSTRGMLFWKKTVTPPPATLPALESNKAAFNAALAELVKKTQEQVQQLGIGAILDAMNLQCKALVDTLPANAADYKGYLLAYFKEELSKIFIGEAKRHKSDKPYREKLWELFNDEARNPIKIHGNVLTRASLFLT